MIDDMFATPDELSFCCDKRVHGPVPGTVEPASRPSSEVTVVPGLCLELSPKTVMPQASKPLHVLLVRMVLLSLLTERAKPGTRTFFVSDAVHASSEKFAMYMSTPSPRTAISVNHSPLSIGVHYC